MPKQVTALVIGSPEHPSLLQYHPQEQKKKKAENGVMSKEAPVGIRRMTRYLSLRFNSGKKLRAYMMLPTSAWIHYGT